MALNPIETNNNEKSYLFKVQKRSISGNKLKANIQNEEKSNGALRKTSRTVHVFRNRFNFD